LTTRRRSSVTSPPCPDDQVHTVAAPGVCTGTTYPGDLYAVGVGTSFSAPLVSGVVALCIATGRCAGLTPQQIVAKIVADAAAYNSMRKNSGYGFEGDPLRPITGKYYGYLISAELY
jgi:subtilisin